MSLTLLRRAAGCAILLLSLTLPAAAGAPAGAVPPAVPAPGLVTMVDLGANRCIPCKLMAPILQELKTEYEGRAAIVFLDVWEDTSLTERFGIRLIPTQIFYDATGRETERHEGFLDKDAIVDKLARLGVK